MDESNSIIYGLESQARALTSQLGENSDVRFFIATQSLKPNNQVHLIELNEDTFTLNTKVFAHPLGEVWKLNSSPHDSKLLASCYSTQKGSQVSMQTALLKLPDVYDENHPEFEDTEILNTEQYGSEIKTTEFHPTDPNLIATVIDGQVLIFNRAEANTKVVAEVNSKSTPKFTTGKWSQHHQGHQFVTLYDCSVRSYDIRDPNHCAWTIENAHSQLVRDLDCNPNRQCHIVTGGDDGSIKIWDCRNVKEPIFCRNDHSHWIWNVRFNTFHDQLILSSSSDCKVLLTCAGSVSSEAPTVDDDESILSSSSSKERIPDGLLQTFEQHEDSVYCVEWSGADPWIFASLSYDGRMILSKVPKQFKYQILL